MKEESAVLTKSYAFSKLTVLLYKFLLKNKSPALWPTNSFAVAHRLEQTWKKQ
jgi:hypothetical protein